MKTLVRIIKYNVQMTIVRYLILLLIFTSSNHTYSQTNKLEIDLFFISCWGDSLIPQGYELDLRRKQIYFVNPVINYLDIKDGKRTYKMKFDREKTMEIFDFLNKVNLSNLSQYAVLDRDKRNYTIRLILNDSKISEYTIPDNLLPSDLRELYEAIIE
jgi:hypothetical protein